MNTADIDDPIFLQAVNAIDEGKADELQQLIRQNPRLVRQSLSTPNIEGYFKDPYLLWFVADNPIRNSKLPSNIVEVINLLLEAMKTEAPDTFAEQVNYALGLVATGRIPRECGFQIAMMDALIDAGAMPGGGMGALAHGNIKAANHLINRGGKLTLTSAVLLNRVADMQRLMNDAGPAEKLTALTAAAFYGNTEMVKYLLGNGAPPNGYPQRNSGFHSHATPLHQAVFSGSLETVKLLVAAGADVNSTDTIYNATPLGWAMHMRQDTDDDSKKAAYATIGSYLKSL